MRQVSFETACAQYVHRYTFDHVPQWASRTPDSDVARGAPERPGYYAPAYASDREWYDSTVFPGEPGLHGNSRHCESGPSTWPLGQWLKRPFKGPAAYRSGDDIALPATERRALKIDRAKEDCGGFTPTK